LIETHDIITQTSTEQLHLNTLERLQILCFRKQNALPVCAFQCLVRTTFHNTANKGAYIIFLCWLMLY